jgi:mono/diheme cytochrome c family protein
MCEPLRRVVVMLTASCMIVLAACRQPAPPAPGASSSAAPEVYTPGLGEIMSAQQMRHTKLWLAGEAGNWSLAAYELDELGEGFDDVVKFHPTHKDSPVAPKDAIPRMTTEPLAALRAAVDKKDAAVFAQAYDTFTAACNSCHQATNFGFNVVQRPTMNPYPNQAFTPVRK